MFFYYIPSSLDVGRLPTVMAEDDPKEVELLFCLSLLEEDWDCPVKIRKKLLKKSWKHVTNKLVHTSWTQGWWGIFRRIFWRFLLVSVSGRVGTRWRIICTVFCVGWIWIRENQIFIYATSHYHTGSTMAKCVFQIDWQAQKC